MLTVKRLVPDDATAYRALMLDAYARHPEAFTSSVAERAALPMARWVNLLAPDASASSVVFGAFEQEQIAGVAGLSFDSGDKTRHKSKLFGMMVAAPFRHAGVGRQLVEAVLAHARGRDGVRIVQLTVSDGNATAQALYERCGFQTFGIEPMAMALGDGFVAKRHMWCALDAPPSLR